MSGLKAPKTGSSSNNKRPEIEAGTYPARLVQVIDLGLQPQRPYKNEPKPPKHCLMTTYELSDEFMIGEDGEPDENLPLWVSEEIPLNPLTSDLANSTKRYLALDSDCDHEGDWTQVVGAPVNITIVLNESGGRVYQNITSSSPMRAKDKARLPELKNEPKLFDLSNPDLNVFTSLPEWLQDKIKSNLEFGGSLLERMLNKGPVEEDKDEEEQPKPKKKAVEKEEDEDEDW